MSAFRWEVPPNKAFPDMTFLYIQALETALHSLMRKYEPVVENHMKKTAPWTDRTGNARTGLFTKVTYKPGDNITMIMDHQMWYGKYLEYHHAGRFAVILPTRDYFGPRMVADAKRMIP